MYTITYQGKNLISLDKESVDWMYTTLCAGKAPKMVDPFYDRLERLLSRNAAVHIGNKSQWINLPELRTWAASKGYTVTTRHNNQYVQIS